jgi:integrase
MATIRKKNGKWQVQIRRKGYPAVSKTFPLRDWAQRWAQETERQLDRGALPPSLSDLKRYLLRDLLTRYLEEITPTKRGRESEGYQLKRLIRDPLSQLTLNRVTPATVAAYRDKRAKLVSGSSVQREIAILRHCLEVARTDWGIPLQFNPAKGLRLPAANPARIRRISAGEEAALIDHASHRSWYLAPIIRLAIATGMRRGELLSLTWNDVDFERKTATLRLTKNGRSRLVPLSPDALDVLRRLPCSQEKIFPVSPNALRLSWERLRKATAMEDVHFHDLRHEAISRFFELGMTIPEVAQISGHRDAKMLLRYAHPQVARITRYWSEPEARSI